jgi:transposase InsO family protein
MANHSAVPWKASSVVLQRKDFVRRLAAGESMTALCAEFGISRKTGYKFAKRFADSGADGLEDRARGARSRPNQTASDIEALIVREKHRRLRWGSKKLVSALRLKYPGLKIPARSTLDGILKRNGLVTPRRRRKLVPTYSEKLLVSRAPNDVWCIDFKGQFRLGNGKYCYTLTITDHFSRYLIACVALEAQTADLVVPVLDKVFTLYGLPKAIRSDNGPPFASSGLGGFTQLSAWWISLGIVPERIDPGRPDQNGRHERMHRTLKEETTRPAAATLPEQQRKFDRFVEEYNLQRPHESLEFKLPAQCYEVSLEKYPKRLASITYPLHDREYRVSANGVIWPNCATRRGIFLTRAIAAHNVGLRELKDGRWLVTFATIDLGHIVENEFKPKEIYVRVRDERAHLKRRPKGGGATPTTAGSSGTESRGGDPLHPLGPRRVGSPVARGLHPLDP